MIGDIVVLLWVVRPHARRGHLAGEGPWGLFPFVPGMAATLTLEQQRLPDRRGLSLVPVLLQELAGLQVRIMQTARDTYRAWRHSRLNSLGVVHRVLRSRAVIEDNHQRNARLGCCV